MDLRLFLSKRFFSLVLAKINTAFFQMTSRSPLAKVADVEREEQYGYVFGVSGPGMFEQPQLPPRDRSSSRRGQSNGWICNQ